VCITRTNLQIDVIVQVPIAAPVGRHARRVVVVVVAPRPILREKEAAARGTKEREGALVSLSFGEWAFSLKDLKKKKLWPKTNTQNE
jgi:hypothetical protein